MTTTTSGSSDRALVLWDVDHTLVSISGVSRAIYERAFLAAVGRPMAELADMTGRTERAIITDTLATNGIDEPAALFDGFYRALGQAAEELQDEIRDAGTALPGAHQALAALNGQHVVQSVVTGNIRSIAAVKLGAFNLAELIDFEVGGYGDESHNRAVLVNGARERANTKYGHEFAGRRTFVIGDTPHDIVGAHDAGAFAVGVATGSSTREQLHAAGADIVLPDLTHLDMLRAVVLRPHVG